MLHDNARPDSVTLTQSILNILLHFEILHHPSYSPDLSPCDYAIFGSLKKFLESERFITDEKVNEAMKQWLTEVGANFWSDVSFINYPIVG